MDRSWSDSSLPPTALPHVRRWVVAGAVFITAGYFISVVVRLLTDNSSIIVTEYIALPASAIGLFLALRGRIRTAALCVIAVVWLELTGSLVMTGALGRASGFPVFPAVVVATGLFFGGRAAFALAALTIVSVPLGITLGAALLQAGPGLSALDLHPMVILDITMLASAFLVHQGIVSFRAVAHAGATHERKFTVLHRNAPYGMVLLDEAGRVESLNPAAEGMLDVRESEARGRFLPEVLAPMTDRYETGPMLDTDSPVPSELSLKHATGRRVVEVSRSSTVLADGSAAVQLLLRDVTERRRTEQSAIELGRMLDRALSEAYVFDADTLRLRFVNQGARRNLGYSDAELDALTITDIVPVLTRAVVRQHMNDLSGGPDETVPLGAQHRRKDGSTYPVEARLHLVTLDGEPALGLFALDVTSRVAAAEEHERLQARMSGAHRFEVARRLAGAIAHEFNNLLMAVGGYAEMIAQFAEEERVRRWAERIQAGQQRGAGLVRQLQGLAHTETAPEPVALGNAVRELLPVLERTLGATGDIRISDQGRAVALLNRSLLEQLALHVVALVRESTPDDGRVEVTIRGPDASSGTDEVLLEVRGASGGAHGAPPAGSGARTAEHGQAGADVNRASVYEMVSQAGGRVAFDESPGAGIVVRIHLPAASPTAQPVPAASEEPAEAVREAVGHILVVEDDTDAREVVALALTRAGHVVRAVGSAEDALVWLEERRGDVDLVLTDVDLPGRNGFALGAEVESRFAPTVVLYMSGEARNHLDGAAPGLDPAVSVLRKPFTTDTLLGRVQDALQAGMHRLPDDPA